MAPVVRLFWRLFDAVDYAIMSARLRLIDIVCGPEPSAPADRQ